MKVLVAGAGHGGLAAAINLARNGVDVTVIEKHSRENLGHDWHDVTDFKTLDYAEIERPPLDKLVPYRRQVFFSPSMETSVSTDVPPDENLFYIDRQYFLSYLIDVAEKSGVKFIFDTPVLRAVTDTHRVKGLWLDVDGVEKKLMADLVIDAAGLYSPVRTNLDPEFNIQNEVPKDDVFYLYRAYFNRTDVVTPKNENRYDIFFYSCNKCGMDWLITEKDFADILVGGFGGLTDEQIQNSIDNVKSHYDFIGDKIIRGGYKAEIPLSITLPVIVANGYACIGDAACMTEPLSGSGMALSFRAGKILADVILEGNGDASVENLWNYEYRYQKEVGENQISTYVLRQLCSSLSSDDVEHLFKSGIMGENELFGLGNGQNAQSVSQKAGGLASRPELLGKFVSLGLRMLNVSPVTKAMPEKYNKFTVKAWAEKYKKI